MCATSFGSIPYLTASKHMSGGCEQKQKKKNAGQGSRSKVQRRKVMVVLICTLPFSIQQERKGGEIGLNKTNPFPYLHKPTTNDRYRPQTNSNRSKMMDERMRDALVFMFYILCGETCISCLASVAFDFTETFDPRPPCFWLSSSFESSSGGHRSRAIGHI